MTITSARASIVAVILVIVAVGLAGQGSKSEKEKDDAKIGNLASHHQEITLTVSDTQAASFTLPLVDGPVRIDGTAIPIVPFCGLQTIDPVVFFETVLFDSRKGQIYGAGQVSGEMSEGGFRLFPNYRNDFWIILKGTDAGFSGVRDLYLNLGISTGFGGDCSAQVKVKLSLWY